MRDCADWIIVEIGECTFMVQLNDGCICYAPCEIVTFCGIDAMQFKPEDVQVIPLRPDVHLYFSPLENHVNDMKAQLLGELTR